MDEIEFFHRDDNLEYSSANNLEEASHVLLSIDMYRKMLRYIDCDEDDSGSVTISSSEYNGLKKALRVLKDKEIQQIDKEKADSNGFTLRAAEIKRFRYDRDDEAWLITKNTPFSLKIPLDEASVIIEQILRKEYKFLELPKLPDNKDNWPYTGWRQVTVEDIVRAMTQKKDSNRDGFNFYLDNSKYGREIKKYLDEIGDMIFKIVKIGSNYGTGTYEVTYWATACI